MKLRIKGNSIRLRLTKNEVENFAESGLVEEVVEFGLEPHRRFIYALSLNNDATPSAVFENNRINVFIPKDLAEEWTQTEKAGIRAEQEIETGKTLTILVEKDFACLEERTGEDESEAFTNPLAGKNC